MKRIPLFLVMLFCTIFVLPSQELKPTLAVLDVVPINVEESQSMIVQNYILDEIHRFGEYSIVERSELEAAFSEMELSLSGAVDDSTAVRIGKIAGAEYILLSSLAFSEGRYHISMRLVSTATTRIVGTSVMSAQTFSKVDKLVEETVLNLLGKGLGKKPVEGFTSIDAGVSLGFPLGRTADVLKYSFIPVLQAHYNFNFSWGIPAAGISVGSVITSTKDDTLSTYNLYSIPVGLSVGYTTTFSSPFFLGLQAAPGAAFTFLVYPESETDAEAKVFKTTSFSILAEIRAGFTLSDSLRIYAFGLFTYIQFSGADYMAMSPGIGLCTQF